MTRLTSIEAYNELLKHGKLSDLQRQVLEVLGRAGNFTAGEIANSIHRPINTVSPRLAELRRRGVVREHSTRSCSVTGKRCIGWVLNTERVDFHPERRFVVAISEDQAAKADMYLEKVATGGNLKRFVAFLLSEALASRFAMWEREYGPLLPDKIDSHNHIDQAECWVCIQAKVGGTPC